MDLKLRSISDDPAKRQRLLALKHNQRSKIDFYKTCNRKADFLENVKSKTIHSPDRIEDPSADFHLWWNLPPEKVLVVKKIGDPVVTAKFREIVTWLVKEKELGVVVEPSVAVQEDCKDSFQEIQDQISTWQDDTKQKVLKEVDFAISVGGDGTLLYAASLFEGKVPPVVALAMGSLGFLTPFRVEEYRDAVTRVLDKYVSITQRLRLECKFLSEQQLKIKMEEDLCALSPPIFEGQPKLFTPPKKIEQPMDLAAMKKKSFTSLENKTLHQTSAVMNEIVVDRGPSPFLANIEIHCNGRLMTTVQGDGVIVATPTGSTAYALAAGASMVHPSVASIIICPICPHSLSFRPVVIPAGVEIMICVSQNARNSAWVGFDGRDRKELNKGDSVVITASENPVPCVNNTGHVTDWFDSLARCFHWNMRDVQKPM